MGHDLKNKDDSGDYAEKALDTAIKGVKADDGKEYQLMKYSYESFAKKYETLETMKRYLLAGNPLVFVIRGNSTTRNEMSVGNLKTYLTAKDRTGGHAILCVGRDEGGFWFLNSWTKNNQDKTKSRFFVSNENMLKLYGMWNWRYWVLFFKAKVDTEYLKRKNDRNLIIQALKKMHKIEKSSIQKSIEALSKEVRGEYPELNEEIPK